MTMRVVFGPATVHFHEGDSMDVPGGQSRQYQADRVHHVVQYGSHGSTTERAARLNRLGREWRKVVMGDEWVHHEFTAAATAYIHALEAEVERVGIVIERSVE